MAKRTFACEYAGCDHPPFTDRTDWMLHVSEHSGRGERIKRPTSCWRCAADIPAGTATCPKCGWEHPYVAKALAADHAAQPETSA